MAPSRKRSRSTTTGSSSKRARKGLVNSLHPPTLFATPKFRTKLRFNVSTTGTYAITAANIADLINVPVIAGVSAYRVTQHYRIKSFEFWAPPSSTGAPVTTYFQWVANATAISDQSRILTDTSLGSDRPGYIKAVPPRNTSHANWQTASSMTVCDFTVVAGTIIDLDIEFALADAYSPAIATTTVPVTGAVNQLCCKALDGGSIILALGWSQD